MAQRGDIPEVGRSVGDFVNFLTGASRSVTAESAGQDPAVSDSLIEEFEDARRTAELGKLRSDLDLAKAELDQLHQKMRLEREEHDERMLFRGKWGKRIINLVIGATVATYGIVAIGFLYDVAAVDLELAFPNPKVQHVRFVTEKIILSLIAATIVQISAIAVTIGNWGFPKRRKASNDQSEIDQS